MFALVLLLATLPLTGYVRAAGGVLDPGFGNNGKVAVDFGDPSERASDMVIQPDGKIVLAGIAGGQSIPFPSFSLARYNLDGSPDTSFGSSGMTTTDFGPTFSFGESVALQSDGKIVVAGSVLDISTNTLDFALARYNSDGSLDSTFGSGGKVITDFFTGFNDEAHAVALQSDGKIVVAGFAHSSALSINIALARYNDDGSLDSSFGVGGKVVAGFTSTGAAVAIQGDGKIIAAGNASNGFAMVRYNTDGSVDASFGSSGVVITPFNPSGAQISDLALQSNGKIVACGFTSAFSNDSFDFAVARYNGDGSLDSGFGSGGKVITDFFGNSDLCRSVALQSDGKIVVSGFATSVTGRDFALIRYNSDGSLDSAFGSGGKITTDFIGQEDDAGAVAVQSDGKIVAAGFASSGGGAGHDFALVRYFGNDFDLCLQDDSSGIWINISSTTGEYLFSDCSGTTLHGTGSLIVSTQTNLD